MGRAVAWVVGTGLAFVLVATPAKAQVHVDVGILAPPVGARVVVGGPPVYVVDRYYDPVYASHDRHWRRERARERAKRDREYYREYYKDMREARREYEKDRREAEREYLKDLREARREYAKDRRKARRDRRW